MQAAATAVDEERRIPRLALGRELASLPLSPAEGFLLSRIDGHTDWSVLREIGGLPPDEAERCLARWLEQGIVELARSSSGEAEESVVSTPEAKAAIDESALDPVLDLSLELQREILEVEADLPCGYHELLGVSRDADAKAIKRAYFALSRRYHPDRYFRREIGSYRGRLEKIFKHLVEAYELLSDPATRAEIERTLGPPPPPEPIGTAAAAPPTPEPPAAAPVAARKPVDPRRAALERLRRRFRIPEQILAERRFRARQFYEAARVSMHRDRWIEAAANIKLAIAFDPWSDEYKQGFAEVQAHVHKLRAAALLESAQASWDDQDKQEALHLFEEAVHYQPCDAAAHAGVARAALALSDFEKAREAATIACELEPEACSHRRALARALSKLGLREEARTALEEALRIDPADVDVKADLMELRRSRKL